MSPTMRNLMSALGLLAFLTGCGSETSFVGKKGLAANSQDSEPKNDTPPAADEAPKPQPQPTDEDQVSEPISVGGAYLVCEINLNAQTAIGMSAVGCGVKKDGQTLAFAKDYMSKFELNTAGTPITDVTIMDRTATPDPYHWEFVIATSRLVGSQAVATLTDKLSPEEVYVLKAPLPPFAGMDIKTQLGFNFDDFGIGNTLPDKDFNDVVICMNGQFRLSLEDKLLVSQIDQVAKLQYQKNAACSQQIQVTSSNPGSGVITIFMDTVEMTPQEKTLDLKTGAKVEVTFKVGAPCQAANVNLFNNANVKLRAEACGMLRRP